MDPGTLNPDHLLTHKSSNQKPELPTYRNHSNLDKLKNLHHSSLPFPYYPHQNQPPDPTTLVPKSTWHSPLVLASLLPHQARVHLSTVPCPALSLPFVG